jgi:asparagine synthase (glutamine-hydrolysing)
MNNQMVHRGPDDSGTKLFNENPPFCGLGHRRLSIIDLSGGHQPMSNEDSTVWITFNGEIYNHIELRKDLVEKGHIYKTKSDTETIVHLYEEYGAKCVEFLRGMFAFAIWDTKKRQLFLVRDRLGIKPLYYAQTPSGLLFASEIKSILKSGWIDPKINYQTAPEFFAFGYVTNENTMFHGIKKIQPGHWLTFSETGVSEKQYWNIAYDKDLAKISFSDCKTRLFEIFEESVRLRLMSDVPLGVFLSGGIDSSSIAAIMAKNMSDPLKAFTIGFNKPYYSEAPYAKEVAETFGIELHEVVLTPDDFIDSIQKLIWHEDKPITWPSGVALYFVAKKAQEEIKVVLTGEGSDELFGGYDKYWVTNCNLKYAKYFDWMIPDLLKEKCIKKWLWHLPIPLKLKKLISHTPLYHQLDLSQIHFDNFYSTFPSYQQKSLFSSDFRRKTMGAQIYNGSSLHFGEASAPSTLEKLLYTDIKTYLVQLLMKQDKMSMAASIESRVPFLDHKLVEFAANVPPQFKIKGRNVKYIIKETMKEILP